jgi:membrane protease YdiL (CAAX protease family)
MDRKFNKISPLQAVAYFILLKLKRLQNLIGSRIFFAVRRKAKRTGTPSKKRFSLILATLIFPFSILLGIGFSFFLLGGLEPLFLPKIPLTPNLLFAPPPFFLVRAGGLLLTLLFLGLAGLSIGGITRDLSDLDHEIEWLFTLPISLSDVYGVKILEAALLNSGWLFIAPLWGAILWLMGYRWIALAGAVLFTLLANFAMAVIQFICEIFFRRYFSWYSIRNLQAFIYLISWILILFLYFIPYLPTTFIPISKTNIPAVASKIAKNSLFARSIRYASKITQYFPWSLLIRFMEPGTAPFLYVKFLLFVLEVLLFLGAAAAAIYYGASSGLEAIQKKYQGKRGTVAGFSSFFFPGIIGKELCLMTRDKKLLITAVFFPLIYNAVILVFLLTGSPFFSQNHLSLPIIGAIGFGIGSYVLFFSIPFVMDFERDGLWMLYTFPRSLPRIIFEKAAAWIGLSLIYALISILIGEIYIGRFGIGDLGILLWTLIGIPLFGIISVFTAALHFDPASTSRTQVASFGLFFFIEIIWLAFLGDLFLPSFWSKLVAMLIFSALALALWQKFSNQADYFLDPTSLPTRSIDLLDGLAALFVFFQLQILTQILFMSFSKYFRAGLTNTIFLSYLIAAFLTAGGALLILKLQGVKISESLKIFSKGKTLESLLLGTAAGLTAGVMGILYLKELGTLHLIKTISKQVIAFHASPLNILLMVSVAAPLFEEVLFRGLIYNGLKKKLPIFASMIISSLIFAMIHPAASVIPVFILGMAAAWSYEKSGGLATPMIAHSLYNAVIVIVQTGRWI